VFLRKYFKRLFDPNVEERQKSEWGTLLPKKAPCVEEKQEVIE
jgi:hypothetical protein